MPMDEYISAEEAAALLGVTLQTLYVYVGRKGIRSVPVPNSTRRRYWRTDVEQARRRGGGRAAGSAGELKQESSITLYTDSNLFFRGRNVRELLDTASFESVAALLWNVAEPDVFTDVLPAPPESLAGIRGGVRARPGPGAVPPA
jgi:citrate synthase